MASGTGMPHMEPCLSSDHDRGPPLSFQSYGDRRCRLNIAREQNNTARDIEDVKAGGTRKQQVGAPVAIKVVDG